MENKLSWCIIDEKWNDGHYEYKSVLAEMTIDVSFLHTVLPEQLKVLMNPITTNLDRDATTPTVGGAGSKPTMVDLLCSVGWRQKKYALCSLYHKTPVIPTKRFILVTYHVLNMLSGELSTKWIRSVTQVYGVFPRYLDFPFWSGAQQKKNLKTKKDEQKSIIDTYQVNMDKDVSGCFNLAEETEDNKIETGNKVKSPLGSNDGLKIFSEPPQSDVFYPDQRSPEGVVSRFLMISYYDLYARDLFSVLRINWDAKTKGYKIAEKSFYYPIVKKILSQKPEIMKIPLSSEDVVNFYSSLRPQQKENLIFLMEKFNAHVGGALIADYMSLGKTRSALTFGELLMKHTSIDKVIVFALGTTFDDWEKEWQKMGRTDCFVLTSKNFDKKDTLDNIKNASVIITNYEIVRNDSRFLFLFDLVRDRLLICDEATKIKNRTSELWKRFFCLASISSFNITLSGTPIENNIGEMYNILKISCPQEWPLKEFARDHEIQETKNFYRSGKLVQIKTIKFTGEASFGEKIKGKYIRHGEECVSAEIGTLNRQNIIITLKNTDLEKQITDKIQEVYNRYAITEMVSAGITDPFLHFLYSGKKFNPLQVQILALIQAGLNDPYTLWKSPLLSKKYKDVPLTINLLNEQVSGTTLITEILSEFNIEYAKKYVSKKMMKLKEIAEKFEKIVVISEYRETIIRTNEFLESNGFNTYLIHGGTNYNNRAIIKNAFEETPKGILCGTNTLAYGANLQSSAAIVQLDLPWNPATFEQRVKRIHRPGNINEKNAFTITTNHPLEQRKEGHMKRKKDIAKKALQI